MTADRLSRISWACGLSCVACFVLALVLLAIFPPAAGHKSAFFSEVGIFLLLLSLISGVLAPTALITGIKALKRFPAEVGKRVKLKTWVGVVVGGFYSSLMVLPIVLLPWIQLTPKANDQSIVGLYKSEKQPENTTELRADGTFVVKERSKSFAGKYRIRENKLTLILPSGQTAIGSIEGGVLIDPDGDKLVKQ